MPAVLALPSHGWLELSWHGLWKSSQHDIRKWPVDMTSHVVTAHAPLVLRDLSVPFLKVGRGLYIIYRKWWLVCLSLLQSFMSSVSYDIRNLSFIIPVK